MPVRLSVTMRWGAVVCTAAVVFCIVGYVSAKSEDSTVPAPLDLGSNLKCTGTGKRAPKKPDPSGLKCCNNIKWEVPRWVSAKDGSTQDHNWNAAFTAQSDVQYEQLEQILSKPVESYPPACLRAVVAARCLLTFNKCDKGLVQIPCKSVCHQVHVACQYDIDTISQFNCDEEIWDQNNDNCASLGDWGFEQWATPAFCTYKAEGRDLAFHLQKEMHELRVASDQARAHPEEETIMEMRKHIAGVKGLTKALNGKVTTHQQTVRDITAGMPQGAYVQPLVRPEDMVGAPSASVEFGGQGGPSEMHVSTSDSTTWGKGVVSVFSNHELTQSEKSRNTGFDGHIETSSTAISLPNPGGRLTSQDSMSAQHGADVSSTAISVGE